LLRAPVGTSPAGARYTEIGLFSEHAVATTPSAAADACFTPPRRSSRLAEIRSNIRSSPLRYFRLNLEPDYLWATECSIVSDARSLQQNVVKGPPNAMS
jgi:hypothetical protein